MLPVDARDAFGRTPLHWAALSGNIFMTEALIMGGADIDAEDNKGIRIMSYAEREGHIDIVKLIVLVANSRV
ncbi:MAG: ankyrin repeat domain-containing protein [Alphaproteobacteria bacterium]|nr:ankyrin repeat domain-containing protein [Alphaproteobacteria bacterium]